MKIKVMAFLLVFSSSIFPSGQMMNMIILILSSAITPENNSFATCIENKKNKTLFQKAKFKNKSSNRSFKKDNFKPARNNIQQPNKRNF